MANTPDDRRNHSAEDRGFNTIQNSSIESRRKKSTTRKYTFFAIVVLVALLVATVLITLIGAVIANIADGGNGSGSNSDKNSYVSVTLTEADTKKGDLLIVNNTHEYTFPATNEHLTKIVDVLWAHPTPRPYQQGLSPYMDTDALVALDKMLTDFAAATGKTNVLVRYAYRSAEDQAAIGSSTKPGYSDHHTGLGCDLKYMIQNGESSKVYELSADPIYTWLTENCHKYGFIIRYPADKIAATGIADYESYFRYVGIPHASYMKANNLCLEEYIDALKAYSTSDPLKIVGADGHNYEISYITVKGDETVKCPTGYAYTLSGTNEGGVVLTIDRSQTVNTESESVNSETTAAESTSGTLASETTAGPSETLPG